MPVAINSACEIAWHRWKQPVVAVSVVPDAAIVPVFPTSTYCTGAVAGPLCTLIFSRELLISPLFLLKSPAPARSDLLASRPCLCVPLPVSHLRLPLLSAHLGPQVGGACAGNFHAWVRPQGECQNMFGSVRRELPKENYSVCCYSIWEMHL